MEENKNKRSSSNVNCFLFVIDGFSWDNKIILENLKKELFKNRKLKDNFFGRLRTVLPSLVETNLASIITGLSPEIHSI